MADKPRMKPKPPAKVSAQLASDLTAIANMPPPPEPMKDRLPAGSKKTLTWDGSLWNGTLVVPRAGTFCHDAASEKRCFWGLDDQYRAYLKAQKAKETT